MLSYQLSPYYCTFPFMNLQIFKVSALGFYVFAALRGRNLILIFPNSIYLFKAKNRNTKERREIYSKLMTDTPERRQWRRLGVLLVSSEHISHLFQEFLVLTLNKYMLPGLCAYLTHCISRNLPSANFVLVKDFSANFSNIFHFYYILHVAW